MTRELVPWELQSQPGGAAAVLLLCLAAALLSLEGLLLLLCSMNEEPWDSWPCADFLEAARPNSAITKHHLGHFHSSKLPDVSYVQSKDMLLTIIWLLGSFSKEDYQCGGISNHVNVLNILR